VARKEAKRNKWGLVGNMEGKNLLCVNGRSLMDFNTLRTGDADLSF